MRIASIGIALMICLEGGTQVLDIGSRLELFVDDYLIESMTGVTQELQHPVPQEVAFSFDNPWEGDTSFYVTVFQDDGLVRCYFRGSGSAAEGGHQLTCYAESPDGISWTRPALGLHEWEGNNATNIIWTGPGTHNFAPCLDTSPDCKPEERYKALAGGPLVALSSPDGIHWELMRDEPVITEGAFDSQNLAFYDAVKGEYVAYLRDFKDGVRHIRRATSQDFLNWTSPEWLEFDVPNEHLYTNATVPYLRAPHIYLAFPKRFVPARQKVKEHKDVGVSDGVFMCSRDGLNWHRYVEAFLRPGLDRNNWTERNNHIACGMIQTSPIELSLYWVENYRHPTCRLRRGSLRLDGFVSISADAPGGELITKPLTFAGKQLVINYETSAIGSVQVEIQNESGAAIPGFELSPEIYGDEIAHTVTWGTGTDVSKLAGTTVRLKFALKDADLYSIRFVD